MKNFFSRKTEHRKLFGRFDIILIIAVLIICASFIVPNFLKKGDIVATVLYDGKTVETVNLSKNEKNYVLNIGRCEIAVEKNEIYFKSSPCKDEICLNAGRLSKSGQFASCVPEKVTILLKGSTDRSLPDVVTY